MYRQELTLCTQLMVMSYRGLDENGCEMYKNENARHWKARKTVFHC